MTDDQQRARSLLAADIIDGMCLTYNHGIGLLSIPMREGIRRTMSQIFEHDVAPAIAAAVADERARVVAWLRDGREHDTVVNAYRMATYIERGDHIAAPPAPTMDVQTARDRTWP